MKKILLFMVFCTLVLSLSAQELHLEPASGTVIIIDPGHGGRDFGAITSVAVDGTNVILREKEINLQIANRLVTILQADHNEWRVLMTRTEDQYLTLEERSTLIMKDDREAIRISLHQNASTITKTRGFTVYYSDWNSKPLADRIAQELTNTVGSVIQARGVKQYDFPHGNESARNTIMIECGFLSNEYEALLLADEEIQLKIATGIAQGIEEYLKIEV